MGKKTVDFEAGLSEIEEFERKAGKVELRITAGTLHKHIGDYPKPPGKNHAMAIASDVLTRAVVKHNGRIIYAPPKGKGARLEVCYPII